MGLGWTLEIMAWIIVKLKATVPNELTFTILTITLCQGIVVFMVFGLKRSNRRILKTKVSTLLSGHYTVTNTHDEIELNTRSRTK